MTGAVNADVGERARVFVLSRDLARDFIRSEGLLGVQCGELGLKCVDLGQGDSG